MSQRILHLTLKKKWFDMIVSGEKPEEYREIKPYWIKRLRYDADKPKAFDLISFRNGYSKNAPHATVELVKIRIGKPNPAWCEAGDEKEDKYILEIKLLS